MENKWYNMPEATKIRAYTQVALNSGIATYAAEKDWWVSEILRIIFNMEIGKYLIFKGGTSLSKAWGLINRFSEDIDLAFDRTLIGFDGELTRTGIKNLRKATGKYISQEFFPKLKDKFLEKGFNGIKLVYIEPTASDADPVKIEIFYSNVIESPGYIQPKILLEISCSSLKEPYKEQPLNSLLYDFYANTDFVEEPVIVPTAIPERTFLEKIFLLHEEFHRPIEKIRVERLSRHLYDVCQLINSDYAQMAIADKDLYETIVKHRHLHNRVGGIDYNLHQPQTINPLPIPEFIEACKNDYKTMQEQMIYGESPSFGEIISTIKDFTANSINSQTWKMDVEF